MFFKKKKEEATPTPVVAAAAAEAARAPAPTPQVSKPAPAAEKATPAPAAKPASALNGSAALAARATPQAPAARPTPVAPAARAPTPLPAADEAPLTPEEQEKHRQAAALSKRISAGLGEIASVFMRSKAHAILPIGQLQTLMPAIARNQFVTAEARSRENGMSSPIAVVIWATVSDEVDKRLSAEPQKPVNLAPAEWSSGPHVWVIEAVGEPRAVSVLIKRLQDSRWKGQTVKLRARGEDGRASIKNLDAQG